MNSVTGEPIRRALIQVSYPSRSAFSDGDGHFEIDGLAAGNYSVMVRKPGFYNYREATSQGNQQVQVGAGTASVTLRLNPYSAIYGRIANVDGQPLDGVPVRLIRRNLREGRAHWDSHGQANSDEDGGFRFANLTPGLYFLSAGPAAAGRHRFLFATGDAASQKPGTLPETGYPAVYYPSAPDRSSASPIQLTTGQQMQADITLTASPVFKISGSVAGMVSVHGVNFQVLTPAGEPLDLPARVHLENGRFEVGHVPPGSYVLTVSSTQTPSGQLLWAEAPITVASDLDDVRLSLEPAVSIPVVVHQEGRTATSDGVTQTATRGVRASFQPPPVAVRLSSMRLGTGDSFATLEGSGDQRSLMLRYLEPGRYTVDLIPNGNWYVQSAQYGQTNLLTSDLTIAPGGAANSIEIVVRDDGASFTGKVKSADGSEGLASVVLVPVGTSKMAPKLFSTTSGSVFNFQAVAPGEYMAFAVEKL